MDKKFMSFILILCTMVSVSIMLSSNKPSNIVNEKDRESSINKNQSQSLNYKDDIEVMQNEKFYILDYNRLNHLNIPINKIAMDDSNFELQNIKNSETEAALKASSSIQKVNNSNTNVTKDTKDTNNVNVDDTIQSDASQDDVSQNDKTVSVFKVEKNLITSEITESEKSKLLSVAKKLSPFDYFKIYGFLRSSDSEQGVKDAMLLLKMKLSNYDYGQVVDVVKRFLNMAVIGK